MTSDAPRPEARAPRGFADRRARDLVAERKILTAVSAVYERYGFEALDTGAMEYADALGKFLPDADRPNEGVFALQDDDEQRMALRYDLTSYDAVYLDLALRRHLPIATQDQALANAAVVAGVGVLSA